MLAVDNRFSEFFVSLKGVRQGENLSRLLFSLFVNDMRNVGTFINFKIDDVDGLLRLLVIIYADYTVILANNITNFKCRVAALLAYCEEWHLHSNCSKTKIVIFG